MDRVIERGVSETLGFVFVFAIIMSMVGLVYASGISGLQDARDAERLENTGRAFDVLAHNIEDVTHRNAPSRATEIKLSEAQIGVSDPIVVEVEAHIAGDPSDNVTIQSTISPIKYSVSGDHSVYYENGAVIREDGAASVMRREPGMRLTSTGTVIPLIETTGSDEGPVGGSTTVLVRTASSSTEVSVANSSVDWEGWINVTSPRADAWERHLAEYEVTDCTRAGDTVSCAFQTQRLYVTQYRLSVAIEE